MRHLRYPRHRRYVRYERHGQDFAAIAAGPVTASVPATKSVATGADLTIAATVAGGLTPYTYRWYWKGSTGDFIFIDPTINPTAATDTLINHAVTAESAGSYQVRITDNNGSTVTSNNCVVTVTA